MITTLKIVFSLLLVGMCYVVIHTSMQSNLFTEWNHLVALPWMRATLWDFYANVLVIYLWICYQQRSIAARALWLVLMIGLGSIASCLYVLIRLFKLQPGEGWQQLLLQRNV